jgi:hypothetical protein
MILRSETAAQIDQEINQRVEEQEPFHLIYRLPRRSAD